MERGAVLSGVAHNTRSWELFFFFQPIFFPFRSSWSVYLFSIHTGQ